MSKRVCATCNKTKSLSSFPQRKDICHKCGGTWNTGTEEEMNTTHKKLCYQLYKAWKMKSKTGLKCAVDDIVKKYEKNKEEVENEQKSCQV